MWHFLTQIQCFHHDSPQTGNHPMPKVEYVDMRYYGLNYIISQPKFISWSPNPQSDWRQGFEEVINEVLRARPLIRYDWCPYKKIHHGCTEKGHVRTRWEGGQLPVKERGLRTKPSLPTTWSWTCSLQNFKKWISAVSAVCSVYGSLSWLRHWP